MAYSAKGLTKFTKGGAIGTGEGSVKSIHAYATNDTAATVEAASYFDAAATAGFLTKGDLIMASLDVDGTPAHKTYTVASISSANVVAITPAANLTFTSKVALNCTVTLTNGDSGYVVAPIAGTVDSIKSVLLGGAVTTNDATVTAKIGPAAAGVAITTGVITITAASSAIGDLDTCSPTAAKTVVAGDLIYFTVSGTPGGSRTATVTILIGAS